MEVNTINTQRQYGVRARSLFSPGPDHLALLGDGDQTRGHIESGPAVRHATPPSQQRRQFLQLQRPEAWRETHRGAGI